MFRAHQAEAVTLGEQIVAGVIPLPKYIGGVVACGGGKQGLAGVLAHYLVERGGLLDKVCWVVPNGNLRRQAAASLTPSEWLAKLLGHKLRLYEPRNTPNPSRGGHGYVVTYHALRAAPDLHRQEFERHRYLLILDEPHHCVEPRAFADAVRPLVERAGCVLFMSGTLERDDKRPIAFLPYTTDGHVDTTESAVWKWIKYGRKRALQEKAIIPTEFMLWDGRARWEKDGEEHRSESFGDNPTAVFVALSTQFAVRLLDDGTRHWQAYRERHPRSKLLVVCGSIKQADRVLAHLQRLGIHDAAKATHEDDDADDVIKAFAERADRRVLVTVQKTYEGLDVPAITHLICLTHIRSRPWIEQMLARAWRYDSAAGPWESQRAYVWAPDDLPFVEIARRIEAEDVAAAREMPTPADDESPPSERQGTDSVPLVQPLESAETSPRAMALDGQRMSTIDTSLYADVGAQYGLSPLEVVELLAKVERAKAGNLVAVAARTNGFGEWADLTPEQHLTAMKAELNKLVQEAARRQSGDDRDLFVTWIRSINTALLERYRKRDAMTEDECRDALAWVRRTYDID